jgi:hypothetical protein
MRDFGALLRDHLGEAEPDLSYGAALLKSWHDPARQALYALHHRDRRRLVAGAGIAWQSAESRSRFLPELLVEFADEVVPLD